MGQKNHKKEEHSFIHETIKEKHRGGMLLRIGMAAVLAAVFGTVAAIVFALVVPVVQRAAGSGRNEEKIELEGSSVAGSASVLSSSLSSASVTTAENSGTEETEENGDAEIVSAETYAALLQSVADVAEQSSRAMVQVTGITSNTNYFNETIENSQETAGVIISSANDHFYILTENRSFEEASAIEVTFYDSHTANAELVRTDPITGLAVLRVPLSQIPASSISSAAVAQMGNSYSLKQGEPVIALGAPMGYGKTMSIGKVTSTGNIVYMTDIQYPLITTDISAAANGSSVIINMQGQIVGVMEQKYAGSSSTGIYLGISDITELVERLSNNESTSFIGIKGQDVTDEIHTKTGMPVGILVTEVEADSPAMLAGIKQQDVIIAIGDKEIHSVISWHTQLGKMKAGDTVTVTAMRLGKDGYEKIDFDVTVGSV